MPESAREGLSRTDLHDRPVGCRSVVFILFPPLLPLRVRPARKLESVRVRPGSLQDEEVAVLARGLHCMFC